MKRFALAAAAALGLAVLPASAQNLVTDGSFESGRTYWDFGTLNMNATLFAAHTGNYAAETGCSYSACLDKNTGAYFRQTIATSATSLYTLSFYVAELGGQTSGLRVYWDGVDVLDIANPYSNSLTSYNATTQKYEGSWRLITVSNLPGVNLTALTGPTLEIHGYKEQNGDIFFDDISVTPSVTVSVPEPATWAMTILGLGAVGASLRTRRRRTGVAAA